ncbi:aldehyde dehydrogenase family protein (plasmid) [Gemmobacter fulvus]|uniref:Aldehyde dehydrogenase family protein n=1 Tax=Gemmobacter fulvus TaxID=2840474 RepID=A0A975PC18_9RHOB|nr:aldehyde dehydrogenase family protein [Gemmobacter fulvus]MDQ1850226.1 aldehyde dehydrogenase family protein [Gemmobacter fulvus]QWK92381.1 aldehyde dehydrogenase family protein [Gemmobacter fulvus]
MLDFSMTIGGRQVAGRDVFAVHNPASGAVVGHAPNATLADLDAAVAAARAAFPGWAALPDDQRAAACAALAGKLGEHAEEIARLITLEQGKPLGALGSRFEMGGAQAWAGHTASLSLPMAVIQDDSAGRIELHHKPIGVVGSITPWNWPVMIAIWHILPALRAGNCVVIKPSPYTPLSTLRTVAILNTLLPPGVLNVVTSDDRLANIGAAMATHEGIGKIVFTGSCATGTRVMQGAAPTMKRLTLELGGNDAGIVLPDCDPAAIAEGLFWGAFINNGQTCAAMKRLYVHDSLHDAVCDALVAYARTVPMGDGIVEGMALGPINNRMQFDKVARLVADAARDGTVLLGGAPDDGLFFPVTLVADLPADAPLIVEEQFGPALPIIRYHDVEEAVAAANDSDNGLGGSVWSRDADRARDIALRLDCGSVWVNRHGAIQPNAPFGGVKRSGFGREFGEQGLAEMTELQTVFC